MSLRVEAHLKCLSASVSELILTSSEPAGLQCLLELCSSCLIRSSRFLILIGPISSWSSPWLELSSFSLSLPCCRSSCWLLYSLTALVSARCRLSSSVRTGAPWVSRVE